MQSVAEAVAAAPRLGDDEKVVLLEKVLDLSGGQAPASLALQVRRMRLSLADSTAANSKDGNVAGVRGAVDGWAEGERGGGRAGVGLAKSPQKLVPVLAASPSPRPTPAMRTAVVVMCFNRPQYLQRTLERMMAVFPEDHLQWPFVYVSQDGSDPGVANVARSMQQRFRTSFPGVSFEHWNHPQETLRKDDQNGYAKLARHFGWALGRLFDLGHPRVIIVEDDLELGADFFSFFAAVAPLLDRDESLLAASAYNDIGQRENVGDPRLVVRADFFPGLGWMLPKRVWAEIGPKWPAAYWDDWLREPAQRQGRHILRPEVSRSRTFGERGVSRSQFFGKFLANIHINDKPVDFLHEDLSYLQKDNWDRVFARALQSSVLPPSLDDALDPSTAAARCPGISASAYPPMHPGFIVRYADSDRAPADTLSFAAIANKLQIINDAKAGVPRTAYQGVVTLVRNNCRLFLVPASLRIGA